MKLIMAVMIITIASSCFAAESADYKPTGGEFGLVAATGNSSSSIGVIYNINSSFALNSQFNIYQQDLAAKYYGSGLSLSYYFLSMDNLTPYAGVGLAYSYNYAKYKNSDSTRSSYLYNDYTVKCYLGGRFMINNRIALFADAALLYTREKYTGNNWDTSGIKSSHKSWYNIITTKSAQVGVIFYIVD